jgi:hypothetical protein
MMMKSQSESAETRNLRDTFFANLTVSFKVFRVIKYRAIMA